MLVVSGKEEDGKPCEFYIDGILKRNLDIAKKRIGKNWDYVAIVAGIPGSGKSTFVKTGARYCCPWFDETYYTFSGQQFIEKTNSCPERSAVVLDESFQSLNSKIVNTREFLRIINHLQIIRSKNLYIFLCLPNFFDLSKGIAIFRSSHLFVTYATLDGSRGRFLAFGRVEKRRLYVRGGKFMNYNAVRSSFRGRYTINENIIKEIVYERIKLKHLKERQVQIEKKPKQTEIPGIIINLKKKNFSTKEIMEIVPRKETQITQIWKLYKENTPKTSDLGFEIPIIT